MEGRRWTVHLSGGTVLEEVFTQVLTLLTTWISERIVTVIAVSVLTVAAVPTALVITSHHDDGQTTTVSIMQPVSAQEKAALVTKVTGDGDAIIAKIDAAEASCDTTLTKTVSNSKVSSKVGPALADAKAKLHSAVAPLLAAVRNDEDHFEHLAYVSQQDEENELDDLNLIRAIALGNGQTSGTITITCQTLTVTITETINITIIEETVVAKPSDEGDD